MEQLHISEKQYPSSEQNEVEEREEDGHCKENGDDGKFLSKYVQKVAKSIQWKYRYFDNTVYACIK